MATSNVKLSTGMVNQICAGRGIAEILAGGHIDIRSGTAPATADLAVSGTLLARITRASLSAKVARVVTITPAPNGETGATWRIKIKPKGAQDYVSILVVDDGTPSVAELCTLIANAINAACGGAITTPACVINSQLDGLLTASDDTTHVTVTAATAGVSFDLTADISSGAAAGTITVTETVADAYGLHFEEIADVSAGVMEKNSSEVWSGVGLVEDTAAYFRHVQDDDDGTESTTQERIQGSVSTSGAPLNITNVNIKVGQTETVKSYQITVQKSG